MKMMIKVAASIALLLTSLAAFAIDLDTAKADGLVGERADGYLGAVKSNVSADVQALIDDINGKRKVQYERIAQKNNIPLKDVEVLAGKKAIEKTPEGGWVLVENWQRK